MTTSVDELLLNEYPFDADDPKRGGWAYLEVMGHRDHHGFVREIVVFGAAMCEVLVPFHDKLGVQFRHVYGGSAIFSITPRAKSHCVERAPRDWSNTSSPVPLLGSGQDANGDNDAEYDDGQSE